MILVRVLAISAVTAPLLAVLLMSDDPSSQKDRSHLPSGYAAILNDFLIPRQYLSWTEQAGIGQWGLTKKGEQEKTVKEFYDRSFLHQDIEWLNDPRGTGGFETIGRGAIFNIYEDTHQIESYNATFRGIPLPMNNIPTWRGKLKFRSTDSQDPILSVGDLRLRFLPLSGARNSSPKEQVSAFQTQKNEKSVELVEFRHGSQWIGTAFRIGEDIVYQPAHNSQIQSGIQGKRLDSRSLVALRNGSVLQFTTSAPDTVNLRRSDGAELGTVIRSFQPLGHNAKVVSEKNIEWLGMRVDEAMSGLAVTSANRETLSDTDIVLSLDQFMHHKVDALLRAHCDGARSDRPFRAAVTVMNALNGEILALGSYPRTADELGPSYAAKEAVREKFLRDHNFSRMEAGSVAKVLFSAAILAERPELATLRISNAPPWKGVANRPTATNIFGVWLDDFGDHEGGYDRVNFENFIVASRNRYAAALMLLASSKDPLKWDRDFTGPPLPDGESFELEGHTLRHLPNPDLLRLRLEPGKIKGADGMEHKIFLPKEMAGLEDIGWVTNLERFFDVAVTATGRPEGGGNTPRARQALEGDDSRDTRLWNSFLDGVLPANEKDEGRPELKFADIAPERTNLSFNLVHSFRGEYVQLMLGGSESRWTPIKLAEAFSRLVTGTMVDARLTSVPAAATMLAPLDFSLRSQLGVAMNGVVSQRDGTAHGTVGGAYNSLRREVYQKSGGTRVLEIFAKTGTPNLGVFGESPLAGLAKKLIKDDILQYDGQDFKVRVDTQIRPTADARTLMEGYPAMRSEQAELLARRIEAFPKTGKFFVTDGPRLVDAHDWIARTSHPEEEKEGTNFVFVAAVYDVNDAGPARNRDTPWDRPVDMTKQPVKAYSTAIMIQRKWVGGSAAMLAAGLLRGPLREALLEDRP